MCSPVSAFVVVFFLVHGALGNAWSFGAIAGQFSWLVWVGVACIAVHVVLSVITSAEQLGDKERPPSARKKRHLALKWATGLALAAVAFVHVAGGLLFGLPNGFSAVGNAVLLAILCLALAVHACVGARSLLKDLNLDRRYKGAFRLVVCLCAAALAIVAFANAFAAF